METEQLCRSSSCCSLNSSISSSSSWSIIAEGQTEVVTCDASDHFPSEEQPEFFLNRRFIAANTALKANNERIGCSGCHSRLTVASINGIEDFEMNTTDDAETKLTDSTLGTVSVKNNADDDNDTCSTSASSEAEPEDLVMVDDDGEEITSHQPIPSRENEQNENDFFVEILFVLLLLLCFWLAFYFWNLVYIMRVDNRYGNNAQFNNDFSSVRTASGQKRSEKSNLAVVRFCDEGVRRLATETDLTFLNLVRSMCPKSDHQTDEKKYLSEKKQIADLLEQLKHPEKRVLDALQTSLARLDSLSKSFQQSWRNILRWSSNYCSKEVENRYPELTYDCVALVELANTLKKNALLQSYIKEKDAEEYLEMLYDIATCNNERVKCEFCFWSGSSCDNKGCKVFQWQKDFDTLSFLTLNERVLRKPFSKLKWSFGKLTTFGRDERAAHTKISSTSDSDLPSEEGNTFASNTLSTNGNQGIHASRRRNPTKYSQVPSKLVMTLNYWEQLANLESTREHGLREWAAEVLRAIHTDGAKLTISLRAKAGFDNWKNRLKYWEQLANEDATREYALNMWIDEVLKMTKRGGLVALKVYPAQSESKSQNDEVNSENNS